MDDLKAKLLEAGSEAIKKGSRETRNGILLHGAPGNGKTFVLEALAQELKVPLVSMTYGEVVSRWVGQTTEQLMDRIAQAKSLAPCVLFIDECDSLLEKREDLASPGISGGVGLKRTTNTLLTEAVALRGSGVVLVAATNFIDSLDEAAIREGRFDWKIEVGPPDELARIAMLKSGLAKYCKGVAIPESVVLSTARRWKGYSAKRILAVTEQVPSYLKRTGKKTLDFDDLKAVLREVQGADARPPEGTKSLEELVLGDDQRMTLSALAMRLQNAFEIEEAGGTLPTGLLFSGPPGTGKTETARALAKASGYAFLACSGNDLMAEPKRIDKLWRDAMNLRPAILFVDEADDLLADRSGSPHRSVTNKFLTVMDGSDGKIPDVLFIAATNHPDQIDSAALRGGRFTEKVEFRAPDAKSLTPWVAQWLGKKGWTCEFDVGQIAEGLDGQSMANVQAILQQAINVALTSTGDYRRRALRLTDLESAARTVLGTE
jgi:transitional endoplasmic reticulum ATPase